MADSSVLTSPVGRSRYGLRFSLRALLLLVTLVAIGLWYWYRVPYSTQIEAPFPKPEQLGNPFEAGGDPFGPPPPTPLSKEVQRHRRVLWGEPIRHGLTELYYPSGERFGEDMWREGVLHGASSRWYRNGKLLEKGAYARGKREGGWKGFDAQGRTGFEVSYNQGVPHGDARWFQLGKLVRTARHNQGQVTEIDGREVDDLLGRTYRLGGVDAANFAELFQTPATWDFLDTPLFAVGVFVEEAYRTNVFHDRKCPWTNDTPVTFHAYHMTGGTFLAVLFDEMARDPRYYTSHGGGPAAVYRHGCIWITTKEDAQSWVDRTGVPELRQLLSNGATGPQGEQMRERLEHLAIIDFVDDTPAGVSRMFKENNKVDLTFSGVDESMLFNMDVHGVNLWDGLASMCDLYDLHVRWDGGTTLIVEPQPVSD